MEHIFSSDGYFSSTALSFLNLMFQITGSEHTSNCHMIFSKQHISDILKYVAAVSKCFETSMVHHWGVSSVNP